MKKKTFKISDEKIKEMYLSGSSLNDIAKVAQDTKGLMALRSKLIALDVDTTRNMKRYSEKFSKVFRKYSIDETVFDCIDTEEKAYWLGFLYADGYNNEKRTSIALRLQIEDLEILKKFKKFLKTDTPIKTYTRTTITGLYREYCELHIGSIKLSKALASLGCTQGKTYTIKFPSLIPKHLIPHFIRGVFDGDGCISIKDRKDRKESKVIQFTLTGKEEFMRKCQDYICEATGVTKTSINTFKNCFSVSIHYNGRIVVTKILDYLYKDSTIYLKRKHDKYLNLVSR